MTSPKYGKDFVYTQERIRGTLVRWGEVPFYVKDLNTSDGIAYGLDTLNQKCFEVNSQELNLEPPRLGYVNGDYKTFFAARTPARHWKQGLSKTNLLYASSITSLTSSNLAKTIMGIYEKPVLSLELVLCGEKESAGFCRDFSFRRSSKKVNLVYKDLCVVGTASPSDTKDQINYQLKPEFEFLQESLEGNLQCFNKK